jgi:hypothetical protein
MIELVLTVCLMTNNGLCRDQKIIPEENVSITQCMMGAIPTIAEWQKEHPKWIIQRWKCQEQRKDKEI